MNTKTLLSAFLVSVVAYLGIGAYDPLNLSEAGPGETTALPEYTVYFMAEDSSLYEATLTAQKVLTALDVSPHFNIATGTDVVWYEVQDTIVAVSRTATKKPIFSSRFDDLQEGQQAEGWHLEYETGNPLNLENPDSTVGPNPATKFIHAQFPLFVVTDSLDNVLMMMSRE